MSDDGVVVTVQRGPRAGSVFRLPPRQVRVLGSDHRLSWRLGDLPGRAAVFRRTRRLEVQLLVAGRINGQVVAVGTWLELRCGDHVAVGPHELVVTRTAPRGPLAAPAGFELERELGRGGAGIVYSARRAADGARVALKLLHWARPRHLERLRREAATCLALDHPAISRVLEIGVDDTPPWVALELVDGQDAAALVRGARLPIERAVAIAADVASALAWLGERHLVHRDVKLENVLVGAEGSAKLTDFGLVKDLGEDLTALTATGTALGTLAYAAPEQLENAKDVTPAADVFGLGVTLFGLLTGQLPWSLEAGGAGETRVAARGRPRRDVRQLRPEVPNILAKLVGAMLRDDPGERPPAGDVEKRLRQLLDVRI